MKETSCLVHFVEPQAKHLMSFRRKPLLDAPVSESRSSILSAPSVGSNTSLFEDSKTIQYTTFFISAQRIWTPKFSNWRTCVPFLQCQDLICLEKAQLSLQYQTDFLCLGYPQLTWMHLAWVVHLSHFRSLDYKCNLVVAHCKWAADSLFRVLFRSLFSMVKAGLQHLSGCWCRKNGRVFWNC